MTRKIPPSDHSGLSTGQPPEPAKDQSGDDDALLAHAYTHVTPLKTTARVPMLPAKPNREQVRERRARASEAPATDTITKNSLTAVPATTPEDRLEFQRPGLQIRQWQKLRQGKLPCGLTVDLHGMTRAKALRITEQLITESQAEQVNCIHIIHGKGYGSGSTALTLKAELNHWLREHPQVLAFCSALPADGGAGALYVLLKRARPET